MVPARSTGQLDQISQAIGRLEGMVEGIDRYNHEREHGIRDMSGKIDGVGALISREVTKLKVEMQADFGKLGERVDRLSERVDCLEAKDQQQAGAKNLAVWLLQSPLIGWIAAALLFVAAWWKDHPK